VPQELSPADAAALVRPADTIGVPLGTGQPVELLHALGARTDWVDLEVLCAMLVDFYELPTRTGVRTLSTFYGPAERIYRDQGAAIEFIPADYRRWAPIMAAQAPRVMCTVATPPDADGWLSLSCHAGSTVSELHRAGADPDRLLIVEASPQFPRTFGLPPAHPHRLHLDEIDVLVHSDRRPVELVEPPVGPEHVAIAEHATGYVKDRSTLQTGFGSIPSMVAANLADGPLGDFGVHSEMFTTGLMRLHQKGKVTNRHKGVFPDRSISTFAAGVTELYLWLDEQRDVAFVPVEVVNDPVVIASNRNMVTVNGATAVDLTGQVAADTIRGVQWSGVGGHEDFVSGGGLEGDDRSLICLPATATVGGTLVSRIEVSLGEGAIITTPRHQTDVVITEFGAAELRGRTVRERAHALAAIAHPDFRPQLDEAAERLL
jgi:acyl-CoA hydrolase